ncbi:MAG: PAS domain-containing protein, partial [Bacteroidales bacterium]|nr:PAS domain-containing protein [Bacteroidales bacterium]
VTARRQAEMERQKAMAQLQTSLDQSISGIIIADAPDGAIRYANPAALPPEEVEEKEPKGNHCPPDKKVDVGLAICSIAFDCESVEFGCAAGAAFSLKKNFVNKSTTAFVGVGVDAGVGFAKAEATAGFTMTRHANGDLDVGVKGEVTGRIGAIGKNYEGTVTVMEGPKGESKDVIGF